MAQQRENVYTAVLQAEAVAASTGYVVVDLSDTTNFPHSNTGHIDVLGWTLSTEKASSGIFDMWLGVITEVDASNGTAKWFECIHLQSDSNPTDSTDRFVWQADYTLSGSNPHGVNCRVVSEVTPYLVSNISQAGNATWQTDTGLASPAGAAAGDTGKPGAGDIVLWVEEVTNGGTLDFCLTLFYRAQP